MAKAISEFAARVNQTIKAETARRDVSDALLIEKLGISRDTLASRKRGDSEWKLGEIDTIATKILGWNAEDLTK